MNHKDIWSGLDAVAACHGMSVSGLARRAGLDPTSFNRSKRIGPDGRLRWPSTESLARVLAAVDMTLDGFACLVSGQTRSRIPLLGLAQAGSEGFFDLAGFPANQGWDDIDFPGDALCDGLYALEISGESMMPAYRPGDRIIVSPTQAIHVGDRIVLKTQDGEVMAKILAFRSERSLKVESLNADHPPRTLSCEEIAWAARIMWVSQ